MSDDLGPGGPPPMRMTLAEAGEKEVAKIVAEKPQSFTVGVYTVDGKQAEGGITYNRHWSNGWGFTAYAKAWWNDAAVTPNHKIGGAGGFDVKKEF